MPMLFVTKETFTTTYRSKTAAINSLLALFVQKSFFVASAVFNATHTTRMANNVQISSSTIPPHLLLFYTISPRMRE